MPTADEIKRIMAERKRQQEEEAAAMEQQLQIALEEEEAQRRAEEQRMAAELERQRVELERIAREETERRTDTGDGDEGFVGEEVGRVEWSRGGEFSHGCSGGAGDGRGARQGALLLLQDARPGAGVRPGRVSNPLFSFLRHY
jgi:membrane protein involved in colicin uptake